MESVGGSATSISLSGDKVEVLLEISTPLAVDVLTNTILTIERRVEEVRTCYNYGPATSRFRSSFSRALQGSLPNTENFFTNEE
jgi:hypothetical protein